MCIVNMYKLQIPCFISCPVLKCSRLEWLNVCVKPQLVAPVASLPGTQYSGLELGGGVRSPSDSQA